MSSQTKASRQSTVNQATKSANTLLTRSYGAGQSSNEGDKTIESRLDAEINMFKALDKILVTKSKKYSPAKNKRHVKNLGRTNTEEKTFDKET